MLKRFDATEFAQVYTVATLVITFVIMIPAVFIAWAVTASSGADVRLLVESLGLSLAVLVGVGILTFLMAWLTAVVLNWGLARTGGIRIELALPDRD